MNVAFKRLNRITCALFLTLTAVTTASEPPGLSVALEPQQERKPAPEFALSEASGRTVSLKDYRGKVVLVDFWATWCHGCKQEIPWFAGFEKTYGPQGFAVVGVSLDEGGWKVLKPFLANANIPYEIVLGDDATAQRFGIEAMPDTFLIDQQGRVAAAYKGGSVDRANVETNIKALLEKR